MEIIIPNHALLGWKQKESRNLYDFNTVCSRLNVLHTLALWFLIRRHIVLHIQRFMIHKARLFTLYEMKRVILMWFFASYIVKIAANLFACMREWLIALWVLFDLIECIE